MFETPQHTQRKPLTDELHARPFTPIEPPAQALYVALMPEADQARRSPKEDLAHLNALLAHLGAAPAMADGDRAPNFYLGAFDGFRLKWERHTEFVSYLFELEGPGPAPFTPRLAEIAPPAWIERASLRIISASVVEIIPATDEDDAQRIATEKLAPHFVRDSLALTWVTERNAIAMGDFRIDAAGFTRFGVVALPDIGPRRLGRITQRLIEMETYRTLAMIALPVARRLGPELTRLETTLAEVTRSIANDDNARAPDPEVERETLATLSALSADLESLAAETAFRFGGARAYETIVYDRIAALREESLRSRQTFEEFMVRRFKPALRTVRSTEERLQTLSIRGERAANLLRTRIDVSLEEQNQQLLKSMDDRAQLQL
ncbi:MAG: DUF3422 domain-containing protein, partial [Pseudomonadota bacterium]